MLDRLGRTDDARLAYVAVLQREPSHFGALNDLGLLLYKAGRGNEALTCFTAAVAKHPDNPVGHANLALVLLRGGQAALAREHYQTANRLDPANAETHRGLALALRALGESDGAQEHIESGFRMQPLVQLPFRGDARPVRLLMLVSAGAGNVPVERLLDDRVFAISKLAVDYAPEEMALPHFDVAFNAIGDADVASESLRRAQAFVALAGVPVVNPPEVVLETGRVAVARRLSGIPGLAVPRVGRISRSAFSSQETAERAVEALGLSFPLLLRSPGYHTGANFERVESRGELVSTAASLPGDELLAIEFVDARSADGKIRKYRVMFVGGVMYPLHVAISSLWKVHYFSAEMSESAEHRREDEAFLNDMPRSLGPAIVRVLEQIGMRLGLDYGGVDFGIDPSGNAVLFESNATMIVPAPDTDERWAYRREPTQRIERAVRALVTQLHRER